MSAFIPRIHPITAFTLAIIGSGIFFVCAHVWILPHMSSLPDLVGHILAVGLPVAFSGLLYAAIANDQSTSKLSRILRMLFAAILAPSFAASIFLFVGFAFLNWRM